MIQECRHIMPSGSRCHSPALRDTHYCYFHTRLHLYVAGQNRFADEHLNLPVLEDRSAIQIALFQVLNALGSSKLDRRSAGLFLYGLQIASQNVERNTEIVPTTAVPSLTHTREGEELAPERDFCHPPERCFDCEERGNCEDYQPEEEEEKEEEEQKI